VATTQTYTLSNESTQIFRRQQDDLPEHVKVNVYFDDQGPGHPNTRYYLDTPRRQHAPIEFIEANRTYYWVRLRFRQNQWETNQSGIYNGPDIGWWIISDPQHPNHSIYQQEASIPLTITAVTTALQQLPTCPNTPDHPTAMEGQQEEINVATGQIQQEAQRINVITNTSNGALKGNPPFIFDGDRNKTTKFLLSWDLWFAVNQNNDTMKKLYSRIVAMLSYMDGTRVDAWKGEQLLTLNKAMDDGAQETDEDLWTDYLERFRNAFVNQNRQAEAYQELCKLKQGDCYNPPSFSFYSLPQATSGPVASPAPTTQIPQNISQPVIPPSIPPRARTPMLPATFSQAIPAIPITWPTHTHHHSSMEHFIEPAPVITDPATNSDEDSPMRDRSPSPPHTPYQPRPSGSNVYELEANKQPSPPWKAWLSQPSLPTSITQPVSPSSETSAPKRQRHDDGTYTPITSSVTSPISPTSPSAQATPDYQSLPSPRSVGSDQDPNMESPPMLLE